MKYFKMLFVMLVLTIFIAAPVTALAKGCPPGQEKKDWKCVDIEKPDGSNTNTNTNSNSNKNTNSNFNTAFGGAGGDATVKNSGNSSSTIKDSGNSTNLNLNTAKGGNAKQEQGQVQGQKSVNVNNINIEGDTTNVEADKREHIQGPGLINSDAKIVDAKASNIRSKGDLFSRISSITYAMAKKASKNASDMDVEPALLWENDFRTDVITIGVEGDFAGFIYIFSDGNDSYLAAMDAEAAEEAMEAGFTHIQRLGAVETSKHLNGTAWNIGISGGASIMSNGEDFAIAPQGGLGYGKAKSSNQYRPDAVYEVYFDKSKITAEVETSKSDRYMYTAR